MDPESLSYYLVLLLLGLATGALIAWFRRSNDD
jgi:hypothetical protein